MQNKQSCESMKGGHKVTEQETQDKYRVQSWSTESFTIKT